jgi:hypothetical protein
VGVAIVTQIMTFDNVSAGDVLFKVHQDVDCDDEKCLNGSTEEVFTTLKEAQDYVDELKAQPRRGSGSYYRETILVRKWTAPERCPGFPVRDEDYEVIVRWKRTAKRDWRS